MWMRSRGTSSTAMMLALSSRSLAASIIWARQPGLCCTSTSGSSSAKGSLPTSSRAHHTAWPRPSGDCWRVKLAVPASGRSSDSSSSSAVLPRSFSVSSSSNWRSKWSSITPLLRPVTKMKCSMPASRASSTTCWISGRSTTGSISFGIALVAGRKRVPRPATGKMALRMWVMRNSSVFGGVDLAGQKARGPSAGPGGGRLQPNPLTPRKRYRGTHRVILRQITRIGPCARPCSFSPPRLLLARRRRCGGARLARRRLCRRDRDVAARRARRGRAALERAIRRLRRSRHDGRRHPRGGGEFPILPGAAMAQRRPRRHHGRRLPQIDRLAHARPAHHGSARQPAGVHQIGLGLSRSPGDRRAHRQGPRADRQISRHVRRGRTHLRRRPRDHRRHLGRGDQLRRARRRALRAALDRDAFLHRPPPTLFPRRIPRHAENPPARRHSPRPPGRLLGRRLRPDPVHAHRLPALCRRLRP